MEYVTQSDEKGAYSPQIWPILKLTVVDSFFCEYDMFCFFMQKFMEILLKLTELL